MTGTPAHQQALNAIKSVISAEAAMAYNDATKEVTLLVDSSRTDLGAALLQDKELIVFASKALTHTESPDANSERELLAVVYDCERFHTCPYGQRFFAESDHTGGYPARKADFGTPEAAKMLLRL